MDGMGIVNCNKVFYDVVWKDFVDLGFLDCIFWYCVVVVQDFSYDFSGGVGIYGVFVGGQSFLNVLFFYSDFYCFVVVYVGCYDNCMDKISWNE